jgi:ribonucleoside-triphosphate reductase
MQVIKRNGTFQEFDSNKIKNAIQKAFDSCCPLENKEIIDKMVSEMHLWDGISIEEIQDIVIETLRDFGYDDVASSYSTYRNKQSHYRELLAKIKYQDEFVNSSENAASSSETDANANVSSKNVATLEGEDRKRENREIQRYRMKKQLNKMFPELSSQYSKDLENHIIYTHDEASTSVLKPYCMAASLYPLMIEGVGNIDMVTPTVPNDIQSFSGQVTNLIFLLSSQCKGAVATGEYLIALNYYVIAEFGSNWYNKLDQVISNDNWLKKITVKDYIRKGMKQFIYGVNQPAGNRSFNSPFSNLSYYDKTYFNALFEEFYYPDGTQPKWEAIDCLQRIFMELHRELRLIKPLTFPVTTMAMVHDGTDVIDQEYKQLCSEEWEKGGSFFCYLSDNPSSLASCCRVLNEIQDNTFSSINGLQGIMTGSCNVITLNINRIIQDWYKSVGCTLSLPYHKGFEESLKSYIINILERVYKYHIAYKTMLYEWEDKGAFASSNAGYIYLNKLYSTIGIIGYCEAAQFLGLEISNNSDYIEFLQLIFGTIKEQNKLHSIKDPKRPFLFNSEAIPGENLAVKLYDWDKTDGYFVPEDQNLYSSYFFKQWDDKISVLDKLKLHGKNIAPYCDGGQACHIHLEEHLSKEQYTKLIDFCINEGVNYFTFNIPMSECKSCGHVVNAPITTCPKCQSNNIDYWVRIIGYLRPVSAFSNPRQIETSKRIYNKIIE